MTGRKQGADAAGEAPARPLCAVDRDLERFSIAEVRDRWLPYLPFSHATLPSPLDYARDGEDFLVFRAPAPGRRIADGRIPNAHAASLFLQAAATLAAFSAAGTWAAASDLSESSWDVSGACARLWLSRTPRGIATGGTPVPASDVLRPFAEKIFGRRGRAARAETAQLFGLLEASDAAWRRPEIWVAFAYRLFPELADDRAAEARCRTRGSLRADWRSAAERARIEKARAILHGRRVRLLSPVARGESLEPGAALGVAGQDPLASIRALREAEAGDGASPGPAVWICAGMERWDRASREAIQAAAISVPGGAEIVRVPESVAAPASPEEWRSALFVPCGAAAASLKFYERLASARTGDPAFEASRMLMDPSWAAYAADPTGDAPLRERARAAGDGRGPGAPPESPSARSRREREVLEALSVLEGPPTEAECRAFFRGCLARTASRMAIAQAGGARRDNPASNLPAEISALDVPPERRRDLLRKWAAVAGSPGRRITRLLAADEAARALEAAEDWRRSDPSAPPRRWFELSARLSAAIPKPRPAWIDAVEAERELAGGRVADAEARLREIAEDVGSALETRRAAELRLAEVYAMRGQASKAAAAAAAWSRRNSEASPAERARALRLEAAGLSRLGEPVRALALLDQADAEGSRLPPDERVETALVRAGALSRAGRFDEEAAVYAAARADVAESADERLGARLLAAEALGLSDRREFDRAIARLERALEILRDDPVERAKISIDLAATLHHAGGSPRCAVLLEEAGLLAASVGRNDLARIAAGNLVQSAVEAGDSERAGALTAALLDSAMRDGDPVWTLVALHHRSRLALREGRLPDAARDNAEARDLASRIGDRLEIGELWLEDGDRAAFAGDLARARASWQTAAEDPPDRCDSAERARARLAEVDAFVREDVADEVAAAKAGLERRELASAEAVARWSGLFPGRVPAGLREAAENLLRARGAPGLAAALTRESGPGSEGWRAAELRRLRDCVALTLADPESIAPPLPFGMASLSVCVPGRAELLRIGARTRQGGRETRRRLHSGAAEYELAVSPPPPDETLEAIALLVETLLFRPPLDPAAADFARGWSGLGVIAADLSMEEPYRRLLRFAPRPMTVLILGESGCGKEAVARAVHSLSPRGSGRFVPVNVSAIPAALLESELFGHARGAFTGADRDRMGLFEEAAGGTIFFDEVGDLAAPLQAKLLRVLQEGEIRRVGENRARRVDVRVVSATSRDLAREVDQGRFREDLFYRLNVAAIELPPLRRRGRDVLVLARHFLALCCRDDRRGPLELAPEASTALLSHSWPGNVRELQSAVASAAALAEGTRLERTDLPEAVRKATAPLERGGGYRSRVDDHRRDLIMEALDRAGGNRTRAARELKLSRQALLYLIRELRVTERSRGAGGARSS